MTVNYDKLWIILNERGMMKTELTKAAKICIALQCKMDDIIEIIPNE